MTDSSRLQDSGYWQNLQRIDLLIKSRRVSDVALVLPQGLVVLCRSHDKPHPQGSQASIFNDPYRSMLASPSYPKVVGKHKRINGLEYCLQSTQIKTSAFIRVHRRTTKYNSALMKSSTQLLLVEVG
ncbi:MAG: hypothetical protein H6Q04_586 [Acidobacteria bacterium]|nr:hypothetical protein [Acidobacteriota bacterium]